MDDKITIALIGAAGGLVSGTLASLIAPWVNWGIEKRKQKLAYRRELITSWRTMIQEVARQRGTAGTLAELLERRAEFHSLQDHLSQETIRNIYRSTEFIVGSTIDTGLTYISREVGKIEKKWKLL